MTISVTVQNGAQILLLGPIVLPLKARRVLLFSREADKTPDFYRKDTKGISSLVLKPLGWVSASVLVLRDPAWPTVAQISGKSAVQGQLLLLGKLVRVWK